jgi:hypothetical protein
MGVLVSLLSQGKGTWSQLKKIIDLGEYEKIFIITNDFGIEKYTVTKGEVLLKVNFEDNIKELRDSIIKHLREPLSGELEADLNIISGNGKEHAALISAMLRIGLGIRLVDLVEEKVEEL